MAVDMWHGCGYMPTTLTQLLLDGMTVDRWHSCGYMAWLWIHGMAVDRWHGCGEMPKGTYSNEEDKISAPGPCPSTCPLPHAGAPTPGYTPRSPANGC